MKTRYDQLGRMWKGILDATTIESSPFAMALLLRDEEPDHMEIGRNLPELLIRIKKKTDGAAALSCVRTDGSVTWQRQEGLQGRFFPIHDLTHYAVETVLGHRRGFYGLVADGWDLTDFGAPWPRGRLPKDLDPSELIVGFLDTERAGGAEWTAADFNDKAALYFSLHGIPGAFRISTEELTRVRARLSELIGRWRALPAGEILELPFDRASFAA